jgi:hypothetical protein
MPLCAPPDATRHLATSRGGDRLASVSLAPSPPLARAAAPAPRPPLLSCPCTQDCALWGSPNGPRRRGAPLSLAPCSLPSPALEGFQRPAPPLALGRRLAPAPRTSAAGPAPRAPCPAPSLPAMTQTRGVARTLRLPRADPWTLLMTNGSGRVPFVCPFKLVPPTRSPGPLLRPRANPPRVCPPSPLRGVRPRRRRRPTSKSAHRCACVFVCVRARPGGSLLPALLRPSPLHALLPALLRPSPLHALLPVHVAAHSGVPAPACMQATALCSGGGAQHTALPTSLRVRL